MRKFPMFVLATAAAIAAPLTALGQYTSNQPVRLVVAQAAGSGTDIAARILTEELGKAIDQPIVVENKPGALGTLAAAEVAKAAPDGHTLLLVGGTGVSAAPHLMPSLPYDPQKDLSPVYQLSSSPMILYVGSALPVRNVGDLVRLVKGQPGRHAYAGHHAGNMAAMTAFKDDMKLDMTYVQYKGGPQALTDVASGVVTAMFNDISGSASLQEAGRVRPLAVMARSRSALAPDVPTVYEEGYKGPVFGLWNGVFAPAGTPQATVRYLNAEITKIAAKPAVQERMKKLGLDMYQGSTPESMAAFIKEETEALGPILKAQASGK